MAIGAGLLGFARGAAQGFAEVKKEEIKADISLQRQLSLLDIKRRYAREAATEEGRLLLGTPEGQRLAERLGVSPDEPEKFGQLASSSLFSELVKLSPQEQAEQGVEIELLKRRLADDTGLRGQQLDDLVQETHLTADARESGKIEAHKRLGVPLAGETSPGRFVTVYDRQGIPLRSFREKDSRLDALNEQFAGEIFIGEARVPQLFSSKFGDFMRLGDGTVLRFNEETETFERTGENPEGVKVPLNPVTEQEVPAGFFEALERAEPELAKAADVGFPNLEVKFLDDFSSIEAGVGPLDAMGSGISRIPVLGQLANSLNPDANFAEAQRRTRINMEALSFDLKEYVGTLRGQRALGTVPARLIDQAEKLEPTMGVLATEQVTRVEVDQLRRELGRQADEFRELSRDRTIPTSDRSLFRTLSARVGRLAGRLEGMQAADMIANTRIGDLALPELSMQEILRITRADKQGTLRVELTPTDRIAINLRLRQLLLNELERNRRKQQGPGAFFDELLGTE